MSVLNNLIELIKINIIKRKTKIFKPVFLLTFSSKNTNEKAKKSPMVRDNLAPTEIKNKIKTPNKIRMKIDKYRLDGIFFLNLLLWTIPLPI